MAFSNGATSAPFYPMPATAKTVAIATIPVREPGSSRSRSSNSSSKSNLLLRYLGTPVRKLKAKFSGAKEDWRRADEARLQETARREQKALQSLRERETMIMTPPQQQQRQQRRQKSENSQRGRRVESTQRQKNENSNSRQRAAAAAAAGGGGRREKKPVTEREEPNPKPKPVIVVDEPPEQVGGEEEQGWLHARAPAKQAPSLGTRAVVASAGKHGRGRCSCPPCLDGGQMRDCDWWERSRGWGAGRCGL